MRNIMMWKGETNLMHGVVMEKMPSIPAPVERGEQIVIPGRDGEVWRGEDAAENVPIPVQLWVKPRADLSEVKEWLSGEGELFLGADHNHWRARVSEPGDYVPCAFNDGWRVTITFDCFPYRIAPDDTLTYLTSPGTIYNMYKRPAKPVIRLELAGDAEINFCGTEIAISGLTGTVWVDCELLECYTADGLAGNHMRGRFPVIPPGTSEISWTGDVQTMKVKPGWRLK